jgi:ribose 5-phosphate isomerase B
MSSKQQRNFDGHVYLVSDHAGFALKEFIEDKLAELGYKVVDMGPHEHDPEDDYPSLIRPAAEKVAGDPHGRGIIFGKSGQGEAMVANRVKKVRAAVYYGGPIELVKLAREHNNATVLSLGAGFLTPDDAWEAVHLFLGTAFSGADRHERRIKMIDN